MRSGAMTRRSDRGSDGAGHLQYVFGKLIEVGEIFTPIAVQQKSPNAHGHSAVTVTLL